MDVLILLLFMLYTIFFNALCISIFCSQASFFTTIKSIKLIKFHINYNCKLPPPVLLDAGLDPATFGS